MDNNIQKEQEIVKKEELRKAQLEAILMISGSEVSTKNEKNTIIIPNSEDIASSLAFKSLKRDKLSEKNILDSLKGSTAALKSTFGADFSELKPVLPPSSDDTTPTISKELYDEQVALNDELFDEIKKLNDTINAQKDEIGNLKGEIQEAVNDKLGAEQSNDALANQLDATSGAVDSISEKIETALQKSIEESILRASLQAQNMGYKAQIEALIKQTDSLNSIIEGLQSQLGAVQQQQVIQAAASTLASSTGGTIVNDVVVASAKPQSNPPEAPIVGRINNLTYEYKWDFGQQLFITNNDLNSVSITVEVFNPPGQNWLSSPINTFELAPGDSKDIDFIFNAGGATFTAGGYSSTHSGNVRVTARRKDGSQASSNLEAKLLILHPDVY